jgi:hypothetical protein
MTRSAKPIPDVGLRAGRRRPSDLGRNTNASFWRLSSGRVTGGLSARGSRMSANGTATKYRRIVRELLIRRWRDMGLLKPKQRVSRAICRPGKARL